jgi:undecaprenyl-diphosphatase
MTVLQSILLGFIQGITEFLPVSSSGHLVIVPTMLGWEIPPAEAFIFDVLVQVATLIAVLAFFWKDYYVILRGMVRGIRHRHPLESQPARLGWYLLLASVPAGLAGLFLKDSIERAFDSPLITAIALFGTAILLVIAERVGNRIKILEKVTPLDALVIGLFQILALFPGISRSGATIAGGMTRNLQRPAAARFAFLMSTPIMLAAGLNASIDLIGSGDIFALLPVYLPGFIAAAVVGYLAIGWLLSFLTKYSLYYFAAYCVLVAIISLLIIAL